MRFSLALLLVSLTLPVSAQDDISNIPPPDPEIERMMRLCEDDCDQTLGHDDLIGLLRRVESVPPELLAGLYQDELLVGCDLPSEDPPASRLQALRTLMRAFGYLEPPPPPPTPPCSAIF